MVVETEIESLAFGMNRKTRIYRRLKTSAWFRFFSILILSLWWGGLTIYAGVVVPIGAQMFGSTRQGFVTQQVTYWLNVLLLLAILAVGVQVFTDRQRWLTRAWSVLIATLIVVTVLHLQMDGFLDFSSRTVNQREHFYQWHRLYLWTTAAQWLAGIGCLWGVAVFPTTDPNNAT